MAWEVVEMKAVKSHLVRFEVSHQDVPIPILLILGPLLGLGYIIVLPFIGLANFILTIGFGATRSLAGIRRRVTQTTVDMQEEARAEAVVLKNYLQPLIDGLDCEFMVIDREFHITQYHTPLLRQSKLLEQTAIGKHCFEVSHGRNRPCDLWKHECPMRKVLGTNEKVTVTHYHENQLEGIDRQRLVKVLAVPVRDSQGNITHVAELIWDVQC